jgi:hypothetical protein
VPTKASLSAVVVGPDEPFRRGVDDRLVGNGARQWSGRPCGVSVAGSNVVANALLASDFNGAELVGVRTSGCRLCPCRSRSCTLRRRELRRVRADGTQDRLSLRSADVRVNGAVERAFGQLLVRKMRRVDALARIDATQG